MSEGTLDAQLSALMDAGLLVSKWEMRDGKPLHVRRIDRLTIDDDRLWPGFSVDLQHRHELPAPINCEILFEVHFRRHVSYPFLSKCRTNRNERSLIPLYRFWQYG